ncbi:PBP2a family beta-lactam-resistant peptidoglycan transpeptidase MecD [Macrococcus animalis]|uniref:PBP2a family beta-lactam-resistant peptidoglycan transpeptidase MecD n=1 Tax=Macrococcus animalis TaxID=3395467 RepID=UPI0039BE2AF0
MKNIKVKILIVCSLCLISFFLYNLLKENEIDKIFSSIENRNVDEINENITFLSRNTFSKKQRYDRMNHIDNSLGIKKVNITDIKLLEEIVDTRKYSANMHYDSKFGKFTKKGYFEFEKNGESKRWELNWTPEVIIPGLTATNEVRVEELKSSRGEIVDRNGIPLAIDGEHYQVGIDPKNYNKKDSKQIAKLLNINESTLKNKLKQSWVKDGVFVPIKSYVELSDEIKNKIPEYGLSVNKIKGRTYPLKEASAHLLGYIGEINADELNDPKFKGYDSHSIVGKTGIEYMYDKELQNRDGLIVYITEDDGLTDSKEILVHKKPKNGKKIVLSIDSRVQNSIYNHLKDDNGSGTAMNPKTGELLALVSYPSFNPYDFMFGISNKKYQALLNDKKAPLLNKFQELTSPGSTQKLLTSIIGLNNGVINESKSYEINGKGWRKDGSWGGYKVTRFEVVNGRIDLEKAIAHSDNIFFARTTLEMGGKKFVRGMKDLGVGEETPSDYPVRTGQIANKINLERNLNNDILLADSGYGQGEILVNPIHILSIYSSLVNEGNMMAPKLNMEHKSKVWKKHITSQKNIDILTSSMRKVVTGTHKLDTERNYANFAGKTGTAELKMTQNEGLGTQIGWFVGYDQQNPNMMLAINVKNVEDKGMSSYNAQKFAQVMDDLYEHGARTYEPDSE